MKTFGFQWHLTNRCNLRCAHCYQDNYTGDDDRDLNTLREYADAIFQGLPDRLITVNLTGGEPLLLPFLPELIDHLHGYANLDEVNIITNGTIATEKSLAPLARFEKLDTIRVSIEGGDPISDDAIRGAGHWSTVAQNIPRIKELTGKNVALMMTLARYNLHTITAAVEFGRSIGASEILFERFVPLRDSSALADQSLDAAEWFNAVEKIVALADEDVSPLELLAFRAFRLSLGDSQQLSGALCNLGDESMALMPNGDVYPCRRYDMRVASLSKDPFPAIVQTLAQFSYLSRKERLNGPLCAPCPEKDCTGCRALCRALGDEDADDLQCALCRPPVQR